MILISLQIDKNHTDNTKRMNYPCINKAGLIERLFILTLLMI